jgi:hypothetical protein
MDFEVLPGPSRAELARTALARAAAAAVTAAGSDRCAFAAVPVGDGTDGQPVLLPAAGSALARLLAAGPATVAVAVPADTPFTSLRLAGTAVRHWPSAARCGTVPYAVTLESVEFAGSSRVPVALEEYRTAAPDPLWREAPGILHHLEHCHMAELVACVRAHGLPAAECVVPRALDRFGLELLVLSPDGLAACRLAFPDGPVTALRQVPASVRAMLTCRCASSSHPGGGQPRV